MGNKWSQFVLFGTVIMKMCACTEVNLFVGLSGAGKTTILGNLCGKTMAPPMSPQNGIKASTLFAEEVDCAGQVLVDTIGLMHMTDATHVEDAYFEGLNELLKYVNRKNIGRIYVVTDSTYMKDSAGRVLDQVDFLKSVTSPLIPWTAVVNCMHGVCPSSFPPESRAEFFSLLSQRVENMIEVESPHLQPVPREKFPIPAAYFPVALPQDWESLIKFHKMSSLREEMEAKARGQCDQYKHAVESAVNTVFQCDVAACQPADCDALPACPPPQCPDFPCQSNGDCKRHRREAYSCHFMGTGTCHRDHYWDDQDCLRAVRECHQHRSDSCNNHNTARADCIAKRDASCNALVSAKTSCENARDLNCAAQRTANERAKSAVLAEQRPLYARCVLAFAYPSL